MKVFVFITLGLITFLASCQSSAAPEETSAETTTEAQTENDPVLVREVVSVERFKSQMAAAPDFYLLDVRTPEEFEAGHIEGAVNINFYDDDFDAQIQQLDRAKPIFVYCGSGKRSASAASKMQALEFHQVFDLEGGFNAWPSE